MDVSSVHWLPELAIEDTNLICQSDMSPLDQLILQQLEAALEGGFEDPLSLDDYASCFSPRGSATFNTFSCSTVEASHPGSFEGPTDNLQTETWNSNTTTKQVPAVACGDSSRGFLSFGNEDSMDDHDLMLYRSSAEGDADMNNEMEIVIPHGKEWSFEKTSFQGPERAKIGSKSHCDAQDHAVAEKKRRERLTQRFIALSAIVPGLKKTDKASIIGDAINYLKQLEAKVKTLEGKAVKRTVESLVLDRKPHPSPDGDPSAVSLLEIQARVFENTVLMRIHCEKRKGLLVKLISEVEKLHLTVMNTNAVSFASSSYNITMVAKIEEGFSMASKDLDKNLKSAFSQFM